MNKYYVAPPSKIQKPSEAFLKAHAKFMKRAYKELLEDCSRLMGKGDTLYKTLYTLDGEMIETMDELKSLCETDEIRELQKIDVTLSPSKSPSRHKELPSLGRKPSETPDYKY